MVAGPVAMAALLVGCGDGGEDGDGRPGAGTLTVVGTEMAFAAPASVPAGDYEVTFRNEGKVYHELAFKDPSGRFVTRRSIAAGQQVTMEVSLDQPGTWELGCFEPGHYEAGMYRSLEVG